MSVERDPIIRAAIVELGLASREAPSVAELESMYAAPSYAPRRSRRWTIAIAVAIAVLLLIGLPALYLSFNEGPVVDESTTTTTTELPTTTTSTTVLPPQPEPLAWGRVGGDVMRPIVGIFAMSQTDTGLVAAGFDPGDDNRQNGVIFMSDDGVTWTRLGEEDPALDEGAVLMYGVTQGGPGLVAVGMGCADDSAPCPAHPTVWTSVDGTTWTRTADDDEVFAGSGGALFDVITLGDGLITVGGVVDTPAEGEFYLVPVIFRSTDGVEWVEVLRGDRVVPGEQNAGINALAIGDDGLVVAVGAAANSEGAPVAAVWTSLDGIVWTRADLDAPAFAGETPGGTVMLDVAWGLSGFVAVGTDGGSEAAAWQSDDGLTWDRVEPPADDPFAGSGTIAAVTALEDGFLAAGPHGFADRSGTQTIQLWTSPDGRVWDRVRHLGSGYVMSVATHDSIALVAGGIFDDAGFSAAVWAGDAFDAADPPPDPGVPEPPQEPEEPESRVTALPDGLSCADLSEATLTYVEAVAYWSREGRSAELDDDADGIPCEETFDAAAIAAVFGPEDALAFEISSNVDTRRFDATGPAVDAGLICATGTTRFADAPDSFVGGLWRWNDEFTCDDGSGGFMLGADVFVVADGAEYGVWSFVSGTGDHEGLGGGGPSLSGSMEDAGWADQLVGRIWQTTEEE